MDISIIIPTLNEAGCIGNLLSFFRQECDPYNHEIIVVDGGSTDDTVNKATEYDVNVLSSDKGRARQMNAGAQAATGKVLYFVHADTMPPKGCLDEIWDAYQENTKVGCYRFKFDKSNPFMRVNSFFTRLPFLWCRGGDQSLFVSRAVFDELNGFKEDYSIMEDYDFISRAKKLYAFKVLPKSIKVSSRKYEHNSYVRVNLSNILVFTLYQLGLAPNKLAVLYRKLLN